MLELRPYQVECVNRVLSVYEEGESKYEIVVLPTGSGKTIIFSHIIHELQNMHGMNVIVIAHREELISQAADKFRMIKPDAIVGKVGAGSCEYGAEVTVASIQTICRDKHIAKMQEIGYGLIIVDEAHHIMSASYQKVLQSLPGAFVLGVTATPERLDKKDICKGRKPLFQIGIMEMIKDGWLCNVRAVAIQTDIKLDSVRRSLGDFNDAELDRAVNVPQRNALIVQKYKEYTPGKRAICFGVTIDHINALSDAFNEAGVPSAVVTGSTPLDERKLIYQSFHKGEILILCSVMVCTEGYDEPLVEVVIPARPTQSKGLFTQMIGRGLRLAEGKSECVLLDITDNCTRHKLSPYNLKRAIEKENLKDGEDVLALLAREEKEIQVRKLREKRLQDKQVDLFSSFDWTINEHGVHVIEVGHERHKIALSPSTDSHGMYYVRAKIAHELGRAQNWARGRMMSFEEAKAFAEMQAQKILDDVHERTTLVDVNHSWRNKPASEKQLLRLRWIDHPQGLTSGQACDLIDEIEHSRATKQARKAERQAVQI